MKNLIIIIFLLCSNILLSQGALVIDTKMTVSSFQLKHMEENQYNQMPGENIDSNYVVIYYEEYQAYDMILIDDNGYEYYATFKVNAGGDYSTKIGIDDIQIICGCSYEFINIGKSKVLSITF